MAAQQLQPPSLFYTLFELRILYEIPSYFLTNVVDYQIGDGHPILVLPGFLSTDLATIPIRSFLKKLDYQVHGWRLGLNLGYSEDFDHELMKILYGIYHYYKRKVSLVGWSLGGVFARETAKKVPEMIRNVITLGSPFNDIMTCTNLKWIYDIIGREKTNKIKNLLKNLDEPPPVPTTAIYSDTDGVASGYGCMNKDCSEFVENIPVWSSHIGLGFNYKVYKILADRLSQPEDDWKPYENI